MLAGIVGLQEGRVCAGAAVAQLGSAAIDEGRFVELVTIQSVRRVLTTILMRAGIDGCADQCAKVETLEQVIVASRSALDATYANQLVYSVAPKGAKMKIAVSKSKSTLDRLMPGDLFKWKEGEEIMLRTEVDFGNDGSWVYIETGQVGGRTSSFAEAKGVLVEFVGRFEIEHTV